MSTQSNLNNNEISENINIDNNIDIEKIVKKRGRKPKNKNIEENNDEKSDIKKIEEPKVLKKRGRKPKVKTEEEEIKIPKKRGRKPKEKIYSVKELPKTFYEENKNETLILHLPIDILSKEEKNIQPLPSDSIQNNYGLQESNIINENEFNLPTQMNLLENDQKEIEKNENQNEDKEKKIKEDKSNSKAWSNNINHSNKVLKKNLRNILYQFIIQIKRKFGQRVQIFVVGGVVMDSKILHVVYRFHIKKINFMLKEFFAVLIVVHHIISI